MEGRYFADSELTGIEIDNHKKENRGTLFASSFAGLSFYDFFFQIYFNLEKLL